MFSINKPYDTARENIYLARPILIGNFCHEQIVNQNIA